MSNLIDTQNPDNQSPKPAVAADKATPFKIRARLKTIKGPASLTAGISEANVPTPMTRPSGAETEPGLSEKVEQAVWVPYADEGRTKIRKTDLLAVMGIVIAIIIATALPKRAPTPSPSLISTATVGAPVPAGMPLASTDTPAVTHTPAVAAVATDVAVVGATPRLAQISAQISAQSPTQSPAQSPAQIKFVPVQAAAQPSEPTVAEPTPSTRPVSREAVQKFVTDFYLANENLSAEQIDAIYAPTVQYFGSTTSRRAVVREKLAYYRRWPDRQFTLDPDTLKIATAPSGPRIVDISFDYDFNVRSADRTSTGRGIARLTLDLSGNEGQIIREEGRVTVRGR
jgi:hypothetical protein